jgi:hypothetical protein
MKVVQTQILNLSNNSGQSQVGQISIPYLLKDRVLLSPGVWNGLNFSKEQIALAFNNTDWNNKENFALIYDHDARASNWLGNVINRHLSEDGSIIGDLELYDEDLINKLVLGKAKLGISARVLGMENELGEFENFTFNNFSVVYDPACKNAYINLSKDKQLEKLDNIFFELKEIIKELSGESTSEVTSGASIDNACTGQKIKYGKKKLGDDEEEVEEDEEITELNKSKSLSENLDIIERGSNMIEKNMAENENVIIEESKNLETEKNYSAELSDKLDKILLSLTELTKSITELNSKEVKLEEEVKVVEEVKEEEPKEELKNESEELSQLKKEVQELKANSKVALSEPKVAELAKPRNSLLGTPLTPAENKLRDVLLKNANQTN